MKKIDLLFLVLVMAMTLVFSSRMNGQFMVAGSTRDSVEMGALYASEVYYNMAGGIVSVHDRNTWDIAFRTMKMSSSILINDGKEVVLYTYPKSDTSGWATVDTSGLSAWTPMYNDPDDWENGAFSRYAMGYPDYGWCAYNTVNHNLTGDSLFIIRLRDGSFRKLWIIEKKSIQDIYLFRYANLDGTGEQNITLDCNLYISKDFIGFNMITNAVEDFQPEKNSWDLVFTKYMSVQPNGQAYPVTGVLSNDGIREKEFRGVDPFAYTNYNPGSWDSTRSSVGYDWKNLDATYSYYIVDSLVYFVQDLNSHIFKLYFTYFAGGSTGKVIFEKEQLTGLGYSSHPGGRNLISVYPNPASDIIHVFLPGKHDGYVDYSLTDLSGKNVASGTIEGSSGPGEITVNNLAPGIYLLKVITGNEYDIKKVIISR